MDFVPTSGESTRVPVLTSVDASSCLLWSHGEAPASLDHGDPGKGKPRLLHRQPSRSNGCAEPIIVTAPNQKMKNLGRANLKKSANVLPCEGRYNGSLTRAAALALSVGLTLPAAAASGATLEEIKSRGYIRVAIANEIPGGYLDPSGEAKGPGPAVARHVGSNLASGPRTSSG